MKSLKVVFVLFLSLLLIACSNDNSKEDKQTSSKSSKLPNIPEKVFSSHTTNKKLSTTETKKSIKQYLNVYGDLEKNVEHISNKENLSKKDKDKLKHISTLSNKNENNFKDYIRQNTLPKGYKKESNKIYNYTHSVNKLMRELRKETKKSEDDSLSEKQQLKAVGKIKNIGSKYKKRVNGKQEKEIKDFLKEKNIHTRAFN